MSDLKMLGWFFIIMQVSMLYSMPQPLKYWKKARLPSIDEVIATAADSPEAMDFNVDDDTVLVELDMLFNRKEWESIENQRYEDTEELPFLHFRQKRNAIKDKRWPGNTIPYRISNIFGKTEVNEVKAAMRQIMKYSCIKFREITDNDVNVLEIQNGAGCQSHVGMQGGKQPLYLSEKCRQERTILHELNHAIGFPHEHNRPDRDEHISIIDEFIQRGKEINFRRYDHRNIEDSGEPYDYSSIMHYGQRAFSINEQPTMITKDPLYQDVIGDAEGLSFSDIKELTIHYSCNRHCPQKLCPGKGFVGKDCQCWCPGGDREPAVHCNTVTSIQDTSCKDIRSQCPRFARFGYCKTKKEMMMKTCRKSCGFCGDVCADKKETPTCETWQAEGYCNDLKYHAYMTEYCAKTCKFCEVVSECSNNASERLCKSWKLSGFCDDPKYDSYMKANCSKTCGICKGEDEKEFVCNDVHEKCLKWKKDGFCDYDYNRKYMSENCAKSCDLC